MIELTLPTMTCGHCVKTVDTGEHDVAHRIRDVVATILGREAQEMFEKERVAAAPGDKLADKAGIDLGQPFGHGTRLSLGQRADFKRCGG